MITNKFSQRIFAIFIVVLFASLTSSHSLNAFAEDDDDVVEVCWNLGDSAYNACMAIHHQNPAWRDRCGGVGDDVTNQCIDDVSEPVIIYF